MSNATPIDPGIHLQGCGLVPSKLVADLKVGDVLVWNYGYRSEIVAIEKASAQFLRVRLRLDDGSESYRRLKLSRRVGWSKRETEKRQGARAETPKS